MAVLIIFTVILHTDINVIILSIGGEGARLRAQPMFVGHFKHF